MSNATKATCPPHHWQVTSVHAGESSHEHHRCLRCGAEKNAPAPESPSMFWDRVDPPERHARFGRRGQEPASASVSPPGRPSGSRPRRPERDADRLRRMIEPDEQR